MDCVEREWEKINKCLMVLSEVFKEFEGSYLYRLRTPTFESFLLSTLAELLNNEF